MKILSALVEWLALLCMGGFLVAILALASWGLWRSGDSTRHCDTIYITISAAEVCGAAPNCSLSVDDVEKYLRARKVYGECLRDGAYE